MTRAIFPVSCSITVKTQRANLTRGAFGRPKSKRGLSAVAVADADGFIDGGDEDLAVANLSRPGGGAERSDNLLGARVRHEHFELHFRKQIDFIFRPAIGLGVAFLAAVATHFRDRDALHADANESFLYLVQLVRLYNRFNLFHMASILDP